MEIINIYTMFDKKSEIFDTPFCALDDNHAKRHFQMMAQKPGTMINTFITEFELHLIGNFDKSSGEIQLQNKPKLIMSGNQLVNELRTQSEKQREIFDTQT